jgi:hypothetical protein
MDPKITLELTIQQINTIISGLIKLPIETGLDTFNVVQQQAQLQVQAQQSLENPVSEKPATK